MHVSTCSFLTSVLEGGSFTVFWVVFGVAASACRCHTWQNVFEVCWTSFVLSRSFFISSAGKEL
jgi:hypothetical protein